MMAWNADTTRMPYRMHSEYLRELFLDNAFAAGKFEVDGASDHAAGKSGFRSSRWEQRPTMWRRGKSAYKTGALTRSEVTFVLTNGGHNAGVVSEPGHHHRHYRMGRAYTNHHFVPPMSGPKTRSGTRGRGGWPGSTG